MPPAPSSSRNRLVPGLVWRRARDFADSLAGRLFGIVAGAVLIVEALVFVPAIARFHETWLHDRINLAQVAALALEASAEPEIGDALEYELLTNAEVQRVALVRDGARELVLEGEAPVEASELVTYDYTRAGFFEPAFWAWQSFAARPGRVLRVVSRPRFESGDLIEIVLNEAPLKREMGRFGQDFLLASTMIVMAFAAFVFFILSVSIVSPMRDLTQAIIRFRERPEDASISFARTRRGDEIGRAQRAAADMADQVRAALRQKERLASLGAAVARIGHDLRNMLSTAQLVADRLSQSQDEAVRQLAPRLDRAISRAAGLAASTLKYGRADERAPSLEVVDASAAIEEAAADALFGFEAVEFKNECEAGLVCRADGEHLHRVLVNLMRNAAQALQAPTLREKAIIVRGVRVGDRCEIDVIDYGPGVPEALRERLFEPFVSAAPEAGGAGLGLAIARELTRAMGGELQLVRTGAEGSTFRVTLRAG